MIKIKIVKNDVSTVAKIVIIDEKSRILMLKRSDYVLKYAGEWDLPGGHLKEEEHLLGGLERETFEETGLKISDPVYIQNIKNLFFFYCSYDSQPVNLSHEHVEYKFFEKEELDSSQKFQKVALKALEIKSIKNGEEP